MLAALRADLFAGFTATILGLFTEQTITKDQRILASKACWAELAPLFAEIGAVCARAR